MAGSLLFIYWSARTPPSRELISELRSLLLRANAGGNSLEANELVRRYESLRRLLLRSASDNPVLLTLRQVSPLRTPNGVAEKFAEVARMILPVIKP